MSWTLFNQEAESLFNRLQRIVDGDWDIVPQVTVPLHDDLVNFLAEHELKIQTDAEWSDDLLDAVEDHIMTAPSRWTEASLDSLWEAFYAWWQDYSADL